MPSSSQKVTYSLAHETVWMEKPKYDEAERQYHEHQQQQRGDGKVSRSAAATTKARKQQQRTDVVRVEADVTSKPQQQQHGKNKEKRSKKNDSKDKEASKMVDKKIVDKQSHPVQQSNASSLLVDEISRARQHIKNSLHCPAGGKANVGVQTPAELNRKIAELEAETDRLNQVTDDLRALVLKLETRVWSLEKGPSATAETGRGPVATTAIAPAAKSSKKEDDDDEKDVDLFGSGDEEENDEDKERLRQERLKAYEAKKSKKPALIAKSNIILDIKPWDDETDMKEMEKQVRTVIMDGLVWGASKLVPLAYGIHKLQISCVVEDDKVSVDILQEQIESFDELVQSVDIAAFNKV